MASVLGSSPSLCNFFFFSYRRLVTSPKPLLLQSSNFRAHNWIRSKKISISPSLSSSSHEFLTAALHPSEPTYIDPNQNGRFLLLSLFFVLKIISLWSEEAIVICCIYPSWKVFIQAEFMTARSSLSNMLAPSPFLLNQVNFGPQNPKSIYPLSSKASLNCCICLSGL